MVMAAPAMPDDVQIVHPDPSLPKELSAFWGKWEGADSVFQYFLIVEKIDEEKASVYGWRSDTAGAPGGWHRYEAKVIKERGKYKLWYFADYLGNTELTSKGKYLDMYTLRYSSRLRRVL
jgi:hypothetical protein